MIALESDWVRLTYSRPKVAPPQTKAERLFARYWQAIKRSGHATRTQWVVIDDSTECRMLNKTEKHALLQQHGLLEGTFRSIAMRVVTGPHTFHLASIVRKRCDAYPPSKRFLMLATDEDAAFEIVMRLA